MFRLFLRRNFCSNNPLKKDQKYVYDKESFQKINNKEFIKKLENAENNEESFNKKQNYGIPLFLLASSFGIYFLWNQMPYAKMFKHFTISEYTFQKLHFHSIFSSSLSFQNHGHFLVYYPVMVYSLIKAGSYFKNRQILGIFITNSLLTCLVSYLYEKKYLQQQNKKQKLITPKCNGAVTPLCFMTLFLTIKPSHLLFGQKALPFFIIPATYYMYEYNEFQHNQVNEICRPAHFTSIAFGLFCGIYFKRII